MPTYEYECLKCNAKYDIVCKVDKRDSRVCPKCGNVLKRLISRSSFQIKGWKTPKFH